MSDGGQATRHPRLAELEGMVRDGRIDTIVVAFTDMQGAVFVAPFINSYKRYASLSWAPVNVIWGRDNRTTGFRLVGRGPSLHVENRFPGGDMNAYLTYAAMIGAGLYGIEHGLKLEPEFKGNGYLATGHPRSLAPCTRPSVSWNVPKRPARSSARTSWTTT